MIAIELAMRLPTTLILFTGAGESDPSVELQKRGIASERILLETESRTTAENARYSAKLLGDARHRTWILVSSASHMPRALACFRTAGFGAVPYRVDFVASLDPRFWPRAWREVASSLLYRLPNSLASVLPAALSRRCAVHKSEIAPSNA